ncbi:MAG: peptide deformylase [Candidatus Margulisiibacteriota bacterium]
MSKLKICVQGNPILKKKAKSIKKITPAHIKLMENMFETMIAAPGIGLAAPQVGVSERLIVVKVEDAVYCLANPKIVKRTGKAVCYEGCLSVPGLEAPVERYREVRVQAIDKSGKPVTINADGILAVVFQHEIDHLDGILFIERVKDPSEIRIKAKEDDNI